MSVTYSVGIIRDHLMRRVMQELTMAGLLPDMVTVDALLLPRDERQAALLLDDAHVLCRMPSVVSALEEEAFLAFLENYLAQRNAALNAIAPLQVVHLWAPSRTQDAWHAFRERLQVICASFHLTLAVHACGSDALEWLCDRWQAAPSADGIDFLQGPYQLKSWDQGFTARWRAMACIAIGWLALQVVFNLGAAVYLNHAAGQAYAKSVAMYRDMFPQESRIVDLRAQMEQHLKSAPAEGHGLIALLDVLAGHMDRAHRMTIGSLNYDAQKNALTASVAAADFQALERFRQSAASPAFAVDVSPGVQEGQDVHGTITIRGTP